MKKILSKMNLGLMAVLFGVLAMVGSISMNTSSVAKASEIEPNAMITTNYFASNSIVLGIRELNIQGVGEIVNNSYFHWFSANWKMKNYGDNWFWTGSSFTWVDKSSTRKELYGFGSITFMGVAQKQGTCTLIAVP